MGLVRGNYRTLAQALGVGEPVVRRMLKRSLEIIKEDVRGFGEEGECPTLIGEIGIPYDLVRHSSLSPKYLVSSE